ncbi:unnamed protein product, partial [Phaeothamnion confervicola]
MPQQRNTANRIFGGYLVKTAFELGFAAAYTFGGSRPQFQEVDDVSFLQPVDVGNLVRFDACILYTTPAIDDNLPKAHVEVLARVIRPESIEAKLSNRFNFTFAFPALATGGRQALRRVLPATAEEARRVVVAMQRDTLHELDDD